MPYTDILEPSISLKVCPFVNYMQERATTNVHNVDNNAIVEINVVLQGKVEATQGLTVLLIGVVILCKVLKGLLVNIISYLVKYSLQSLYKQVAESMV